jgi:hypothetical protein
VIGDILRLTVEERRAREERTVITAGHNRFLP